jgi:hypothetical protein
VVLEVTAKDNGDKEFKETRSYYPIGIDLDGYMRYGAWQIKEMIDLTLQPKATQKERFVFEFDENVSSVGVSVNVYYYVSGKKGDRIYTKTKHLTYE